MLFLNINNFMTDQPFCVLPWFHQVVKTNGEVKPCCVWKNDISGYDVATFFNGEFMNELRESFKNNIPHTECKHCLYVEKMGNASYRKRGFIKAKELNVSTNDLPKLLSQEVRLSNLCNLKCRMCNQHSSTKWITDEIAMGHKSIGLLESNWSLSDEQVNSIEMLTFTGGEPMLHQDIICRELTKLKVTNNLYKLRLVFNTNMTVLLSDELIELIKLTNKTSICCSIDGFKTVNEYIRSDTIWTDVENVINQLHYISCEYNNVLLSINMVLNVFNAGNFTELISWTSQYTKKFAISLQFNPVFQDARNLPNYYKNELIKQYQIDIENNLQWKSKYKMLIKHLKSEPTLEFNLWKETLRSHNDFLDMRRNTKLSNILPELDALIRE